MNEPEVGEAGNPYAAPGTDDADEPKRPAPAAHAEGYRAQSTVARALAVLLGIQGAMHVFNGVACAIVLAGSPKSATREVLLISGKIGALHQVLYWVGVIAFGMFVVRCNKNARAFIAATPSHGLAADFSAWQPINGFSPASMLWWYFVPIFCWFKPYQATQAVWFCSAPDSSGIEAAAQGDVLIAWWASWLALTLWNMAQSMLGQLDVHTHNVLGTVTGGLGAVACMAALSMVRALQGRQVVRAAELWP
jgi:hypothetical protein